MKTEGYWIQFGDGVWRLDAINGVGMGEYPDWQIWLALPGANGPTERFASKIDAMCRYDEIIDLMGLRDVGVGK